MSKQRIIRSEVERLSEVVQESERNRVEITVQYNFLQQVLCAIAKKYGGDEQRLHISKEVIESMDMTRDYINLFNPKDSDDVTITYAQRSAAQEPEPDEAATKLMIAEKQEKNPTRLVCKAHKRAIDDDGCVQCKRDRAELGECQCGHIKRSHMFGAEVCKVGGCDCTAFDCKHIHRDVIGAVAVCSSCGDRLEQEQAAEPTVIQ